MSEGLKEAINYLTNNMLLTDKSFPALQTLIRAAKRTAELEQRIAELEESNKDFYHMNTILIEEQHALRQENEALKKAQEWVAKFTNTDSDSDLMKRWDILRNQLLSYPESSSGREIFESIIDEINDQVTPPKGDE